MNKNLTNKVLLIVAVLAICIYGIIGVPSGLSGKALTEAIGSRIHLGLDLKGGAHLILQVVVSEAVSAETDNTVTRIQQDLKAANLSFSQVFKPDPNKPEAIRIEGTTAANSSAVQALLEGTKYSNEYDLISGDNTWTLTMKPLVEKALEEKTVQQAIEAIRDRVDALGVSEPQIQEYNLGANQILVDLPGVENESQIESIIQGTNRLEIHPVTGGPYKDEQEAIASQGGSIPADQELKSFNPVLAGGSTAEEAQSVYVLQRESVVAGNDFRSADPGTDSNTGQRTVHFTLTNEAGDRFYEYTSKNIGQRMAVVMNDQVREVATIEGAIRDSGEIRGSFSPTEVAALSKLLRTGALPASLKQFEKRFVGASLGKDSITQGVTAAIVGLLVVMVFMLIYYRGSGINADLALILNLVILLGFMGVSSSTLTLPGIAGVILTIGMGVDSNVLIFERIREEVRAGKAAAAAVDQGFAHAWITIVDTHVTTIVSAAILFLFG
ncbi:MAG: protein translocase subunit SecD, partial [Terracidiphilus sp.]